MHANDPDDDSYKHIHNISQEFLVFTDHFKAVNDTYGDPADDALLIAVATKLHKLAER
ncbi:GGDEF domain-containing protein [Mariprofundus sp. KV]|uniref:diguanylate cyclase domain-containing protein n=1 Tax=Mariprofundus sp. KV TaxID=2608715 RepID=UPI0015A47D43|nr:GGDEF domain-containing protein [Mariprofundus sp. KV]NWF36409.1 GGDEF domain-containing protein [Mariprofundus sp. KV]